jgi:PAS domain S-box-containing protein
MESSGSRNSERAEEYRARLESILDSCDDAIYSETFDGIITSWNRSAERIFGYSAVEAVGKPNVLVPSSKSSEARHVLASVARGGRVDRLETERLHKDGTIIDVSLTVSPIKDRSDQVVAASKIARDISGAKKVERELQLLLVEAEEADRTKDLLVAMLGHELRNPVGAIRSAFHVPGGGPNENTRLAREVLRRQLRVLNRIVEEMMDTARLISGKILLEKAPLDLGRVVGRAVSGMRASGRFERHEVTVFLDPAWIDGDAVRVEQIVSNLVGNALKFTPAGGKIRIFVTRGMGEAVLRVEDTGIGIEENLIPRVFDLFVQGDRWVDDNNGGLGIGLTMVRRLTALHGGVVYASSPGPGLGSRFTVRFPSNDEPAGWYPNTPAA